MVQPPKDLPSLKVPIAPPQKALPSVQAPATQSQVMIKTEMPLRTAPIMTFPGSMTSAPPRPALTLPKIDFPRPAEPAYEPRRKDGCENEEEMRRFEEAISSISIDVINNESEPEEKPAVYARHDARQKERREDKDGTEYYRPTKLGEGYFSEIEHFLKNRDVKEIIDEVLNKDFLTSMKDYHETKAQGKPFYLHNEDLKRKLELKMEELRRKEEEWHELKKTADDSERKRQAVEHEIDAEGQELKALFRQVKMNAWLEKEAPKEHYFKLKSGQVLKSLNDLRKALTYMPDDEFYHHMNAHKNDFAAWVQEALKNQELAEKIRQTMTKEDLQELLKNPV